MSTLINIIKNIKVAGVSDDGDGNNDKIVIRLSFLKKLNIFIGYFNFLYFNTSDLLIKKRTYLIILFIVKTPS